jgi:type IV fimbrial biogenesis protein FimT
MGDIVRQRGFTLMELLITVVIIGILAGIGVPALRDLVLSNRQVAAVNELVTALQMARSHAITRGQGRDVYTNADPAAVVCPSADGATCGGTWADGWIIFWDANGDNAPADSDGGVLRAFEAPPGPTIGGGPARLRFSRDGRLDAAAAFTFCDDRGDAHGRRVDIGLLGRPGVSKVAAGTCGG